jgi:hypothetical protein
MGVEQTSSHMPGHYLVRQVDDRTWIVRDRRLEESDPRSLIACLSEREPGDLELVWMHAPHRPARFRTFDAAMAELERRSGRNSDDRRPIPIPHFPPPRATAPVAGHADGQR